MQKLKSEILARDEIAPEIEAAWHFMPYKCDYQGSSIHRHSSEIEYECLNCNYKFKSTFQNLEEMWKKGYYCPKCLASFNPVYEQMLPWQIEEKDPKLIPDLTAEYTIMSGIEEHLKCKPYGFKSIDAKRSVRLQHKVCSSIFTATPTMLYNGFTVEDKYTGEPLTTPYCPKCNFELSKGISYGGARMIEKLQNWFTDLKKPFPYKFAEDNLYRFKDYDLPMIVTCAYCDGDFDAKPNELFTDDGESICPYCDGKPMSEDAGEHKIEQMKAQKAMEEAAKQKAAEVAQEQIQPLEETPEVQPPQPEPEEVVDNTPLEEQPDMMNILAQETRIVEKEEEVESTEPTASEETEAVQSEPEETIDTTVESGPVDSDSESAEETRTPEEIINDVLFGNGEEEPTEPKPKKAIIHKKASVVPPPPMPEPQSTPVKDITLESLPPKPEAQDDDVLTMVEDPDVYGTVDQLAAEIQAEQVQQPDFGGYPLTYEPTEVPQEPAPFANPAPVDTPEIAELMHPQEPQLETFEEISQSMGEMMSDLGVEPIQEGTTEEEQPEIEEEDDPNLGIPDVEPEDEPDMTAAQENILDAMGELPQPVPAMELMQTPIGTSVTELAPPSFEGFLERQGIPQVLQQNTNQIDMMSIQPNPQKPVNDGFNDDYVDIDWDVLS